jgi:hypothetical protein
MLVLRDSNSRRWDIWIEGLRLGLGEIEEP